MTASLTKELAQAKQQARQAVRAQAFAEQEALRCNEEAALWKAKAVGMAGDLKGEKGTIRDLKTQVESEKAEQQRLDEGLGRLTDVEVQLAETKAELRAATDEINGAEMIAEDAEQFAMEEEERAALSEEARLKACQEAIEAHDKLRELGKQRDLWMSQCHSTKAALVEKEKEAEQLACEAQELKEALTQALQNVNFAKDTKQRLTAQRQGLEELNSQLVEQVGQAQSKAVALQQARRFTQEEAMALEGEVNKLQGTVAQLQDANEKLRQNKLASEYYLEQELAAVARDKRYSEMEKDQVIEHYLGKVQAQEAGLFADLDGVGLAVAATRQGLPRGDHVRYEIAASPFSSVQTTRWCLGSDVARNIAGEWRAKRQETAALCDELQQELQYGTVARLGA